VEQIAGFKWMVGYPDATGRLVKHLVGVEKVTELVLAKIGDRRN